MCSIVERLREFIEQEARSCSMDIGGIIPLYVYRMWGGAVVIEEIEEAIKGLLTKDAPSGIYHMGDDEALSTNELIEVICSALGKKAHIWRIPRGLMNGFSKIGDVVLHLPLNTQRMQKLTENYVVSNAKNKAALGMKEMPVRAKDGLRETI